ncbi:MAG: preprotein translocase subunit YajC [Legionellales bacterium RIFCSPHIGHO2_12_FULL_42_9]|nr:MAG: preprotein translocase subunit YajC [Legionellales bacterium RIFCSPHIGHO2_12_FULL_42_9]
MGFWLSDAIAMVTEAATPVARQTDNTFSLIMIVAIFVLFYLMLIRPQSKRAKEHRELLSKLQKGDEIVTTGGLLGKVTSIGEQFIKIAIYDGAEVHLKRSAVSGVLPKGTMKSI